MKLIGKLFQNTARAVALRGALDLTIVQADYWVKADTPVDTGLLKRSWQWKADIVKQKITASNPAQRPIGNYYYPYVENGTSRMKPRRMLAKNVPRIEALLTKNLQRLPKWL